MTAPQFLAQMAHVHLNVGQAAEVLGKSGDTVARYRADGGARAGGEGGGARLRPYAHQLPPWGAKKATK